jgi:hypothetical protein
VAKGLDSGEREPKREIKMNINKNYTIRSP